LNFRLFTGVAQLVEQWSPKPKVVIDFQSMKKVNWKIKCGNYFFVNI